MGEAYLRIITAISCLLHTNHTMLQLLRPTINQAKPRISTLCRRFTAVVSPHPVILCGKTEAIAAAVIKHLKPEFEGIPAQDTRLSMPRL